MAAPMRSLRARDAVYYLPRIFEVVECVLRTLGPLELAEARRRGRPVQLVRAAPAENPSSATRAATLRYAHSLAVGLARVCASYAHAVASGSHRGRRAV